MVPCVLGLKRFLLIKNQPKVNQNHLFQQRIFCHVADSNVIYWFLSFLNFFKNIWALFFNNTNSTVWPFHVAFWFIKLKIVLINLGHLFLQPHFCHVSLQRLNVNFYILFGGNKYGPYFSITLMLSLVMFKIDLDFSTCHTFWVSYYFHLLIFCKCFYAMFSV